MLSNSSGCPQCVSNITALKAKLKARKITLSREPLPLGHSSSSIDPYSLTLTLMCVQTYVRPITSLVVDPGPGTRHSPIRARSPLRRVAKAAILQSGLVAQEILRPPGIRVLVRMPIRMKGAFMTPTKPEGTNTQIRCADRANRAGGQLLWVPCVSGRVASLARRLETLIALRRLLRRHHR